MLHSVSTVNYRLLLATALISFCGAAQGNLRQDNSRTRIDSQKDAGAGEGCQTRATDSDRSSCCTFLALWLVKAMTCRRDRLAV